MEHPPDQIQPIIGAFLPRSDEIATATEILLAAQNAQWGPTRYQNTLHDHASYRYYWSVLRRAKASAQVLPESAETLFSQDK